VVVTFYGAYATFTNSTSIQDVLEAVEEVSRCITELCDSVTDFTDVRSTLDATLVIDSQTSEVHFSPTGENRASASVSTPGTLRAVAAVMSAYRDGGTIIQNIKVRRTQKRAAAPSRLLEESIDQAPTDIEREKQRGIQRFGRAFEIGDAVAVIALQQITIELQSGLLEELRYAAFDDAVTDFRYLVDVADAERDKTMDTLIQLRQRLLASEPIVNEPPPNNELRPTQTWAQGNHAASLDASGEEDAVSGAENIPRKSKHRASLLGIFSHRTSSFGGGSGAQTPTVLMDGVQEPPKPVSQEHGPPPRAHTVATDARSSISTGSVHLTQTVATSWNYQPWEGE
jgi:hypothetical protein